MKVSDLPQGNTFLPLLIILNSKTKLTNGVRINNDNNYEKIHTQIRYSISNMKNGSNTMASSTSNPKIIVQHMYAFVIR